MLILITQSLLEKAAEIPKYPKQKQTQANHSLRALLHYEQRHPTTLGAPVVKRGVCRRLGSTFVKFNMLCKRLRLSILIGGSR